MTTRFELVIRELQSLALPLGYVTVLNYDSDGNRTRVTAVKGRCLDRLTTEPNALRSSCDRLAVGFTHVLSEVPHELRTSVEPSWTTTDQEKCCYRSGCLTRLERTSPSDHPGYVLGSQIPRQVLSLPLSDSNQRHFG